ncbi:microtubule motor protein [Aureococcus anophagefferens]|uniref:Kinesin-like protein n=1 Tax=Aureococcus anophagefferens TaxID=44056 RepID=A0ABR1FKQ0_AURAN
MAASPRKPDGSECIRVLIRVRPVLGDDGAAAVRVLGRSADGSGEELLVECSKDKQFCGAFDSVLGPGVAQDEVYDGVADVVASVADGFNACVMAYGQTGAGKTHTMLGPPRGADGAAAPDAEGVLPRALRALFARLDELHPDAGAGSGDDDGGADAKEASSGGYVVHCSFLQIYGEKLEDLLSAEDLPLKVRQAPRLGKRRRGRAPELYVSGLSAFRVSGADEAVRLVDQGLLRRSVRGTRSNDASSRSHAVLQVSVESTDPRGVATRAKLYLVDLAGSEKAAALDDGRGPAKDPRAAAAAKSRAFHEHVNINQSLSALGNVIAALAEGPRRRPHVPYRDSLLTRLLQDALGGNTRTAVVACVAPEAFHADETVSTRAGKGRRSRGSKAPSRPRSPPRAPTTPRRRGAAGAAPGDDAESLRREVAALKAENELLRRLAHTPDGKKKKRPKPSSRRQRSSAVEALDGSPRPPTEGDEASRASTPDDDGPLQQRVDATRSAGGRGAVAGSRASRAAVTAQLDAEHADLLRLRDERAELEAILARMDAASGATTRPRAGRAATTAAAGAREPRVARDHAPGTSAPPRCSPRARPAPPIPAPEPAAPPAAVAPPELRGDGRDVGARVEVYSFRFNRSYAGTVCAYDARRSMHCVHYDTGEKQWHDLGSKQVTCVEAGRGAPAAALSPAPPATTPLSLSAFVSGKPGMRRNQSGKHLASPLAASNASYAVYGNARP